MSKFNNVIFQFLLIFLVWLLFHQHASEFPYPYKHMGDHWCLNWTTADPEFNLVAYQDPTQVSVLAKSLNLGNFDVNIGWLTV